MKSILYLHNHETISGGEQSLINLWRNLDRSRYMPYLALPRDGPLTDAAAEAGVKTDTIAVPRLRIENAAEIVKALRALVRFCRSEKIYCIHSYTPRNNALSAIAAKYLRIPVLWHERNIPVKGEKDLSRKFSFLADAILCNSSAVARRFRTKKGVPAKVTVICNGVDTNVFAPGPAEKQLAARYRPEGRKIVGIVTNLGRRKSPEYFLEAAARILKGRSDVLFLIVGGEFSESDRGRRSELEEKAAYLHLNGHVVFTGFVTDVADHIRLFDVGVSVTEKEACSRAILEMMACAKPVVAFSTGGNMELVENDRTGSLVPFGDVAALADAIAELLTDKDKASAMGMQARARALRLFDVRINAQKTQELYSKLIG
jgi:glycosyltransferase involved in cell wall biosynthesis